MSGHFKINSWKTFGTMQIKPSSSVFNKEDYRN